MLRHRLLPAIGVPAAGIACVIAMQSSAVAATSMGELDGFYGSCDAVVAISDSLPGSNGRIEAWGGFACLSPQKWGGKLTLRVFKGGVKVHEKQADWGLVTTGNVETSIPNPGGSQTWYAQMILSPTFGAGGNLRTGTINS